MRKTLCHAHISYISNTSGHVDRIVIFDIDLDYAARLIYVDAAFGQPQSVCCNGCCAASCSGSFGVTGAALPDFDVQVALIDLAADL